MEKLKTAVIIAGGEGSRLRPLTDDRPKTLVEVNGKPILYWIINWLKAYGIKNLIIGVAYKKEKIYEYMKKNKNFGLNVKFNEHTLEGGTAEGFHYAIKKYVKDDYFLAMNGDELTNLNLYDFNNFAQDKKGLVTMALAPFNCKFSVVNLNQYNEVDNFTYGKKLNNVPVSIGIYIFNKGIIHMIPTSGSIEDTTFKSLATETFSGEVMGFMLRKGEEWFSINNAKDIKDAEKDFELWRV